MIRAVGRRTVLGKEDAVSENLVQRMGRRFGPLGDVELPLADREAIRELPKPVE